MSLPNGGIVCLRQVPTDESKLMIDIIVHKSYQVDSIVIIENPSDDEAHIMIQTSFGTKDPSVNHTEYKCYSAEKVIEKRNFQTYFFFHPSDHAHPITGKNIQHKDTGGVIDPRN